MASEKKEEQYLNIEETAEYMRIPVATLRQFVLQRRIANCKVGKRVIFSRRDIDEFMTSCKRMERK